MYDSNSAIKEYTSEIAALKAGKKGGKTDCTANEAGPVLAAGRKFVPIDEVLACWQDGLEKLRQLPAGADAEAFNY